MVSRSWPIRLEALASLVGGNLALWSFFVVFLDETEPAFGRYPLSNETTWQFLLARDFSGASVWVESAIWISLLATVVVLATSAVCLTHAGKYVSLWGASAAVVGLLVSLLGFGALVSAYIPALQPPLITYFPGPGAWLPLVEFFISAAGLIAINRQVTVQRRRSPAAAAL